MGLWAGLRESWVRERSCKSGWAVGTWGNGEGQEEENQCCWPFLLEARILGQRLEDISPASREQGPVGDILHRGPRQGYEYVVKTDLCSGLEVVLTLSAG